MCNNICYCGIDFINGVHMRIGFCGTQCSGKTTLARIISEELNLPLITGGTHCVPREERNTWESQVKMTQNQINLELQHPDGFVSDRTIFDHLAYTMYFKVNGGMPGKFSVARKVDKLIDDHIETHPYDVMFFPMEYFPMIDDGIREINAHQQEWVFDYFMSIIDVLCDVNNIKLVKIVGSVEERMQVIRGVLCGKW